MLLTGASVSVRGATAASAVDIWVIVAKPGVDAGEDGPGPVCCFLLAVSLLLRPNKIGLKSEPLNELNVAGERKRKGETN